MGARAGQVLLADDDQIIRDLVSFKLTRAGYDVQAVGDGAEALTSILQNPPDVAILDVMIPSHCGFDVLRRIRLNPATSELAVILLTAKSHDSDVDIGFAAGARDYIRKPFSPGELLHREPP